MKLEEFVELFADQFNDTDASDITASTVLTDLDEWSSLIGLTIIAVVYQKYKIALTGNDIESAKTVEDLYNNIMSKA